jgi:hypothetical protein
MAGVRTSGFGNGMAATNRHAGKKGDQSGVRSINEEAADPASKMNMCYGSKDEMASVVPDAR